MIAVVFAMAVTSAVFLFLLWTGNAVAGHYYKSPQAVKNNLDQAYKDLARAIDYRSLKGTDTEGIQDWLKTNDYTYIEIYDNTKISFTGGWVYTPFLAASSVRKQTPGKVTMYISEYAQERISPEKFQEDVRNRIVSFADEDYYVYINVYKEQRFYQIMFWIRLVIAIALFIGIILLYNRRVMQRMVRLSKEVQEVSRGDLTALIDPTSNDEIGRLAINVDTMRNSIVERLQNEKAAWDANTELITAMSHDIRTPLTSLIGYLDIIQGGRGTSPEDVQKYIGSCREKAIQLKDLSDKLFQYFLVFGSEIKKREMKIYDAGILLQQILSEHAAELLTYGYKIDFDYTIPEGLSLRTDISLLRRLWDNLFSNIMKYADKSYHVRIQAEEREGTIIVRIINGVLTSSRKVESNNIGLKTCEKICTDMGGDFLYRDEGQLFTVRASLPVYQGPAEAEEGEVS